MARNRAGRNKRTPPDRKIEKLGGVMDLDATGDRALRYVLVRYSDDSPGVWTYYRVDFADDSTWGYYTCLLVFAVLAYRRAGGTVHRFPHSDEQLLVPDEVDSTNKQYGNLVRHYYLRRDRSKPYPGLSQALREGIQELLPAPSKESRIARLMLAPDGARRDAFRFWTIGEGFVADLKEPTGTIFLNDPAPPHTAGIERHLGQLVAEMTDTVDLRYPPRHARQLRHNLTVSQPGTAARSRRTQSATGRAQVSPAMDAPDELRTYRIPFDDFIADRIRGFGLGSRRFVFEAIEQFVESAPSGYFLIVGDPGIGKSALIATLVMRWRLSIHHFNIALQGISTTRQCIGNICAALINEFQLPYSKLPDGFADDGRSLSMLLSEAARKLTDGRRLIIPIDALDEVQPEGRATPANPLFLPVALPKGVFFVVTSRRAEHFGIPPAALRVLNLEPKGSQNRHDVEGFIAGYASRPKIRAWTVDRKLVTQDFIDMMWERSEGNFMYLSHVLPAIEAGRFADNGAQDLPAGLRAYYRHHWTQMREAHGLAFDELHEPIVCVLASVKIPVTARMVAALTHVPMRKVLYVLKRWSAFLHEHRPPNQLTSYNIYHSAFREFLAEDVDPGLVKYNAMIAERLWHQYRNGTIGS